MILANIARNHLIYSFFFFGVQAVPNLGSLIMFYCHQEEELAMHECRRHCTVHLSYRVRVVGGSFVEATYSVHAYARFPPPRRAVVVRPQIDGWISSIGGAIRAVDGWLLRPPN